MKIAYKSLVVLCSLFMVASLYGQTTPKMRVEDDGFVWQSFYSDNFKKMGALDAEGNMLIPLDRGYTYVRYSPNQEGFGFFRVSKGNKNGACNILGEEILPVESVTDFRGVYLFKKGKERKTCALDSFGAVIIDFDRGYDEISAHEVEYSGSRWYSVKKNGVWGACDMSGTEIISPQYKHIMYDDWEDDCFNYSDNGHNYFELDVSLDDNGLACSKAFKDSLNSMLSPRTVLEEARSIPISEYNKKTGLYYRIIFGLDKKNEQGIKVIAYNDLAKMFEEKGRLKLAQSYYQKVYDTDPSFENAKSEVDRIKAKIKEQKWDKAMDVLDRVADGIASAGAAIYTVAGAIEGATQMMTSDSNAGQATESTSRQKPSKSSVSQLVKDNTCMHCYGTGICNYCDGSGYNYAGGNPYRCTACSGHIGKCKWCKGTGKL